MAVRPLAEVPESRAGSVVATVMLLALGAGQWWLSARTPRTPRLLGSLAGSSFAGGRTS